MTPIVHVSATVDAYSFEGAQEVFLKQRVALCTGFPEGEVWEFIRFLMLDNELQSRFCAYRAANRIREGANNG